jgi:hypothetical protein
MPVLLLEMLWPQEQAFGPQDFAVPRHMLDLLFRSLGLGF